MKRVLQFVVAMILMTLLMLGGAAPYGQDDPTRNGPVSVTPTPTATARP